MVNPDHKITLIVRGCPWVLRAEAKARAALEGKTLAAYIIEAIKAKVAGKGERP